MDEQWIEFLRPNKKWKHDHPYLPIDWVGVDSVTRVEAVPGALRRASRLLGIWSIILTVESRTNHDDIKHPEAQYPWDSNLSAVPILLSHLDSSHKKFCGLNYH